MLKPAALTGGSDQPASNKLLHLTFDSLLGLATPSPRIESNAGELRR